MTLILSYASASFVLQASDRLVVNQLGRMLEPAANKSIIYWARDAIVTIAYTGLASLDGQPTDDWIVEKLRGCPVPKRERRPVMFSGEKSAHWLDIGQSTQLLQNELGMAFASLQHQPYNALPFDLIIAGWQQNKRGRIRPILNSISKPQNNTEFSVNYLPRNWHFGGRFKLGAAPAANFPRKDLVAMTDRVRDLKWDETEQVFVHCIQSVAATIEPKVVGPHCMSILVPPPMVAPIRARFIPLHPWRALIVGRELRKEVPAAFSPWIVGPMMVMAPSVHTGGNMEVTMGPFTIVIQGPSPISDINATSSYQRWPPPKF